jgi:hypothetical protein
MTVTDGKEAKTTITLERGQVAIILGIEGEEITRQLVASPEIDALLDDEEAEIPLNFFLASAFLVRLEQDEAFGPDLADWYDEKLQSEDSERTSER